MVFHIFERTFGTFGDPKKTARENSTQQHLIESGFSEEEAKNLAWFNTRENRGKFYGILGGLWVLYIGKPWWSSLRKYSPRFLYQPYWNPILKLSVVLGGYAIGDYWSTSPLRRAANEPLATTYTINDYLWTREKFVRSFEPLNRKFTEEEIQQFHVRSHRGEGFERKWNYNPYIHGDKEEYLRIVSNAWAGKVAYEEPSVKAKIQEQNSKKVAAGEEIVEKPYNLNDIIDRRGEKQGLTKFTWFKGWRPL